jgi:hypothetical protein
MRDEPDDDWGCEYCRNDGRLTDDGRCPKCDAWYDVDGAIGSTPEDALASLAVVVRVEIALAVERMQP